jgi:hypothetical protein
MNFNVNPKAENDINKQKSIEYILDKGLVKPKSALEKINEIYSNIGLRAIFWDTSYSIIFGLLTVALLTYIYFWIPYEMHYSATFAMAPLLFMVITVFTYISEYSGKIFELKQTFKYNCKQVTALRMLFYSAFGTIFTGVVVAFNTSDFYHFAALFPLCLSALFFVAIVMLYLIKYKYLNAVFILVWTFGNAVLKTFGREKWENFLRELPIIYSVAFALIAFILILIKLKNMLKEINYVYA